ncbi:LacI family DNA-binding transcriptional regulator [Streptomyces pseudoechinosporeus]
MSPNWPVSRKTVSRVLNNEPYVSESPHP